MLMELWCSLLSEARIIERRKAENAVAVNSASQAEVSDGVCGYLRNNSRKLSNSLRSNRKGLEV